MTVTKTGTKYLLASVSGSDRQHDRAIAQVISLEEITRGGEEAGHATKKDHPVRQMYPPHEHP